MDFFLKTTQIDKNIVFDLKTTKRSRLRSILLEFDKNRPRTYAYFDSFFFTFFQIDQMGPHEKNLISFYVLEAKKEQRFLLYF